MHTSALKVCITGATGNIAYAFIPLLLNGQVFDNHQIDLRLLHTPQSEGVVKGVIMEIEDCVYTKLDKVTSGSDPRVMFKDADVIVFLGSFPRQPGMQRCHLLHKNKEIFINQGKALEVANPEVRCVVVANPANANAYILSHFSNGKVKKENITCLSRLDHNRAVSQIAKLTGVPVKEVSGIVVLGNHSITQYSCIDTIKVNDQPINRWVDKEQLQNKFIQSVQNRGTQVINARKSTSVFSAAVALKDHLRDWYRGTNQYVSMGVISEGDYNIPKGLWTSLPVVCKNFSYTIIKNIKLSEFSKSKIKVTVKELQDEISQLQLDK